ncbi:hypothetical protein [Streptomyces sp. ISL-43]|uniref:hypothetical protein n=1 Tax=Streptomyces sp. ISL-43 TaxID=2819183 RepID=UPI002035D903|nr:hypothetical protein [Streptomyces sp. ISL-43]
MPENALTGAGFAKLDDTSASAYRYAVLRGRYERADVAEELEVSTDHALLMEQTLRQLHLLRPMPGEPDVLVPISPGAAVVDLVAPAENEIRELQQSVSEVRTDMLALLPAYFESRRRRNEAEAFDVIPDIKALQAMLDDYGSRCRFEILTAQPGGPRSPEMLEQALPQSLGRLEKGLRLKQLYQHTVRSDLATTSYVRSVTTAGAEVRTTDQMVDRMVIYDREIVFLPEQHVQGRVPGAVVVREPTLVAFLCKVYDHLWAGAAPFIPGLEELTAINDELKLSIVKLMAEGHKDELVARRLGMSVRTARRHISQIMAEVESTSRFQAGFNVAMSGMLDESVGAEPGRTGAPHPGPRYDQY